MESAGYVGSIVENDWRGCLGVFTSRKGSLGPPVGTELWRIDGEGARWKASIGTV